jgi:hypothetical protein
MEASCSTGQSPQWVVVPVEKEEEGGIFEPARDEAIEKKNAC